MLEALLIKWKQHRCKHKFKKHWNKESGTYEMRCTKCEKVKR